MSRLAYPASQAWSDVGRHGSLQDKLDNQVILAQDKADDSRCVFPVTGTIFRPSLALPRRCFNVSSAVQNPWTHFCPCSAMPALFLRLLSGFRRNSIPLLWP